MYMAPVPALFRSFQNNHSLSMTTSYSQTSAVPLSIAVFLATDHYDHNDDPYTISTTTIIKPVRQIILGHRASQYDTVTDLMGMMASRVGTAIHTGIETAWLTNYQNAMKALGYPQRVIDRVRINPTKEDLAANPDIIPVYMEQRLSKKVGKWTVSGKFDFIGQGRLEDFKTASSYVVMTGVNDEKFRMQGSIYRWLGPEIITEDRMAIQYIITDWSSMQARQDPKYPQQRHVEKQFQLKPVQEIDRYVRTKLDAIDQYWDKDETEIPECTAEELQRSEPKYKYYKNGDTNATRSTKNFDDKQQAMIYMANEGKGQGAIKEVPGQVTACRFCAASMLCTQKDRLIQAGELIL